MTLKGWGAAAALLTLAACAQTEIERPSAQQAWDTEAHRSILKVSADDPWCAYVADLRGHLDGGERPSEEARDAALAEIRQEAADLAAADSRKADVFHPFRKAMACELIAGAEEELVEQDWNTAEQFLENATSAMLDPYDGTSLRPLVPPFDHLDGAEPESLRPVDLTTAEYCTSLDSSGLALYQQIDGVSSAVIFPGSLQRAPDWFAHVIVAYNRWGREHIEGHQLAEGDQDFGGVPYHCRRFHAAYEGSKEFAVKENLIVLLAEKDDPSKVGRLIVQGADGREVVLDKELDASQFAAGGTEGEKIDFFADDIRGDLAGARDRDDALPPPSEYEVRFDYNVRDIALEADGLGDDGIAGLRKKLAMQTVEEPLRVNLIGHADCVGPRWYNTEISEARVQTVLNSVIKPELVKVDFPAEIFEGKPIPDELAGRLKIDIQFRGLGEEVASEGLESSRDCEPDQVHRRVVVQVF
ncbi:MAG: hypothetical protein AAF401_15280 [Pseudomonadota bacterium]